MRYYQTMNTIGRILRFTSFGESHGVAVGGVLDGLPAGLRVDKERIRHALARRAGRLLPAGFPAEEYENGLAMSQRACKEPDEVEFLSGLWDGVSLGTPIAFIIRNRDMRPEDYAALQDVFRPGHADLTYQAKYGVRDPRGGGRASARETAARVVAGTIAAQWLEMQGVKISARVLEAGGETEPERIRALIREVQTAGDSIGGIVGCTVSGLPVGTGEPLFDKLQARIACAVMSINACKGFDYGSGFEGRSRRGSELNPQSGGALGGISDGNNFTFRCVFKPTPSISLPQEALCTDGSRTSIRIHGRHDVCVALRAPAVVEAMTALAVADLMMLQRAGSPN